ncbi:protein Mis18-alpha-like [Hyla sarda]|uniref:protein Mis18-alpha-like n=1 Tax=Hyla sarda TaxID=327740 RepID=UPI0024C23133|nr:protein Mis18-alpha-like [Hyla sarda]
MAYSSGRDFPVTKLSRVVDCGILYLCGNCRLPVGDTNDWTGNDSANNAVLLKAVSQFVKSERLKKSTDPHDAGSQYKPLTCSKCHHVLGKFYSSTPVHLNYKCNLYNIDNAAITRYTFGENLQQIISTSDAPVTLEMCHYYEEEFKKQKVLLNILYERLVKLEESFPSGASLSVQEGPSTSRSQP